MRFIPHTGGQQEMCILARIIHFDVAFICNGKYEQKKPVALYKVSKINNWMETWCGFVHLKREAHLKKHYFLFFRPEMHSRVRKLWNCGVLFKLNENDIKKKNTRGHLLCCESL